MTLDDHLIFNYRKITQEIVRHARVRRFRRCDAETTNKQAENPIL